MDAAIPPEDSALEAAAEWFARLKRSEVSTEELARFDAWFAQGGNAKAYAEIEAIWRVGGQIDRDPRVAGAIAKVLASHPAPGEPSAAPRRRLRLPRWTPVPITAVVLALGWWSLHGLGRFYTTDLGEQRLVVLADGSRVRLDTNTRLRVRLSRGERHIDLDRGQAFFEVAHDSARPFVVQAGDTTVQALGTRFDVRREASQVRVALVEGRVKVDGAAARSWTLAPGQQWSSAPGAREPRAVDVSATTSWTDGRLTFHGTAFADALAEVNRYAAAPVRLQDARLADEPISGVFNTCDIKAFVAAMTELYPLDAVRRPDGGVDLRARGASAG